MAKTKGAAYIHRMSKLVDSINAFIVLDEWVQNSVLSDSAPDLSFVDPQLTSARLETGRSALCTWSDMFVNSLDAYRDLLEMSKDEWKSLKEKDIAALEKMVRRAATGVKMWL